MCSERGSFIPEEENPTKATPEEIDTMLKESLQERAPTIADTIRNALDQANEEDLMSGGISPKDFVLQTINAIRSNPENKIIAGALNEAIQKRMARSGLSEEKLLEGIASTVGPWLQHKIEAMKKSNIEQAKMPIVLNEDLAKEISKRIDAMMEVTRAQEAKEEKAAAQRAWLKEQKGNKAA